MLTRRHNESKSTITYVIGRWGHGKHSHLIASSQYDKGSEHENLNEWAGIPRIVCTGETGRGGMHHAPIITSTHADIDISQVTCSKCRVVLERILKAKAEEDAEPQPAEETTTEPEPTPTTPDLEALQTALTACTDRSSNEAKKIRRQIRKLKAQG